MLRIRLVALVALVALGLAAGGLAAAVMDGGAPSSTISTLTPVADSYVRADRPLARLGKAANLVIGGRPRTTAYLRFRVSVPAGATVTRTTLELFAASKSKSSFSVYRVPSTTWGETATNFTNAPPIGARVGVSGGYPSRAYVSVDVTSLVTRGGLVSLAVKSSSALPVAFKSRESVSGRPRLVVESSGAGAGTTTGGGAASTGPCGTVATSPRTIDHVIWIWMENKPYDAVVGSSSAPWANQLAAACGLATNYHAVAHPSLPNYIAATSGSPQGISDDDPPASHPLDVASIYSQVKAVGKTWRDYEESAPGTCPVTSSGAYAVKHDPAPYYTGISNDCAGWDVPMGTTSGGNFLSDLTSGTLPAFSFVTPDLCNDTHDCSVATGDAWLRAWFAQILASPTYLAGRTVVFLTWDEDDGSASNHVPLIVVNPSIPAGAQSGAYFDHYVLLKTTEQLLGIATFIGHAGDAGTPTMVSAFNLG